MPNQPLASLSLTQVHYDPSDPISHVCAWLALLPQGLCIVYVTLIYSTREIEIALTFAGQLLCEALNWGLKRWIKEERPHTIRHLGKGYGMPSSHAQFLCYFAVYVGLFLMWRHSPSSRRWVGGLGIGGMYSSSLAPGRRRSGSDASSDGGFPNGSASVGEGDARGGDSPTQPDSPGDLPATPLSPDISPAYALQLHHPRLTHTLLTLAIVALAFVVSVSRVYLSYHTPKQVLVGALAGTIFAVLWFGVTEWARRTGWVEWLLEWTVVRRARVRDLLCEEDLVELGWQVWEEKRRRRRIRARRKSVRFEQIPEAKEEDAKPPRATTRPGVGAAPAPAPATVTSGKKKKR